MTWTLVSFHAHPDDETLFTGGTLARAAAEGHRVIIVTATDGAAGLADDGPGPALARKRVGELHRAAAALGVEEVRQLGFADSGLDGSVPGGFATAPLDEAARRLAGILTETEADVLTVYDPAGGYGHPDHVQVHRVGVRAAEMAGTPVVLEATVDRRPLERAVRLVGQLPLAPENWLAQAVGGHYADPDRITHCVDVTAYLGAKRAAMRAHATQAGGGPAPRSLQVFLRLPRPLYRLVFGREWFVERGRVPSGPLLDDVFATLCAEN